ncbi:MAG: hypothetical protein E5V72_18145 [Mesorhizobium sp.]|nr:MAG: hypothetical protein E5V72_18145 [Mesorhizobium sp.]
MKIWQLFTDLANLPAIVWNNVATTFTALRVRVTDTASAAASRLLSLELNGAEKFVVDKAGAVVQTSYHRIYNGPIDPVNGEWLGITWAANVVTIESVAAGTGTRRNLVIGFGGNSLTLTGSGSKTLAGATSHQGLNPDANNTRDLGTAALRNRNIYMGSWIRQAVSTVAALPAAATAGAGATMFVSDATAPSFGAAVVGGGAVTVPVYSDGAAWMVG